MAGRRHREEHFDQPTRELCGGCGLARPVTEFFGEEVDWSGTREHDLLCTRCRTEGPPVPDPVSWEDVAPRHRRLLQRMFESPGMSYAAARREVGMQQPKSLRELMRKSPATRRAYQALLRHSGFDTIYLTRKLGLLLQAREARWNPASKSWDWLPDNTTQLGALKLLHQALEMLPQARRGDDGAQARVVVINNLGGPVAQGLEGSRTYVVETTAKPVVDEPAP